MLLTTSELDTKSYPSVIVANAAQRIMADQIIARFGAENIEKIAPSNEIFITVYFKDGRVESYYCGMYMPELLDRDKDETRDKRIEEYCRRFFLLDEENKKETAEEKSVMEEQKKEQDKDPEIDEPAPRKKGRGR